MWPLGHGCHAHKQAQSDAACAVSQKCFTTCVAYCLGLPSATMSLLDIPVLDMYATICRLIGAEKGCLVVEWKTLKTFKH